MITLAKPILHHITHDDMWNSDIQYGSTYLALSLEKRFFGASFDL